LQYNHYSELQYNHYSDSNAIPSLKHHSYKINYVLTVTRPAITHIWESWQFESMYILHEKLDTHNTYASCISPHTSLIRFLRTVLIRGNLSYWPNRVGQMHCSRLHPQLGWVARGTCLTFSPITSIVAVCLSQTSIDEHATSVY
jgi:hypothetical protein